VFGKDYLRAPRADDTARILQKNAARGFPGMLGSIDCMHWGWKNYHFAWQGIYKGHTGECSVILEAVADHDLWIWHAFFGMAGTNNDINVLRCSPVFSKLAKGQAHAVNCVVNNHAYNKGYYLANGIYPMYATFAKKIGSSFGDGRLFCNMLESSMQRC
jgi:hypothetical protein